MFYTAQFLNKIGADIDKIAKTKTVPGISLIKTGYKVVQI
jgi:hypothetical protein